MYDVIIIGAGLGGLSAGAFLSSSGKKVLVLEKMRQIGGYAYSFSRRQSNYEISLHSIGDLDQNGSLHKILNEIDLFQKVKFSKHNCNYSVVTESGDIHAIKGLDNFLSGVKLMFLGLEKEIDEIVLLFKTIRKEIDYLNSLSESPSLTDMISNTPTILKYKDYSLFSMLNDFTDNQELIQEFSRYWVYFSLPPKELAGVIYAYVWTEYIIYGSYYPIGGSKALSEAFKDIIRENGGEIKINKSVTEILIENNRVFGVDCNGQKYFGDVVVSNISPQNTIELAKDGKFNKRYLKKVGDIIPSSSSFITYITLDKDFYELYGTLEEGREFLINNDRTAGFWSNLKSENIGDLPVSLTVYPNSDGENTIITLFSASDFNNWDKKDKRNYRMKKKRWEDELIKKVDSIFQDFSSHVVEKISGTPLTNVRFTSNISGATYGSAQIVSQTLNKRLDNVTPVNGLYLVGGWTKPSSGYSGVIWGGYTVRKKILEREGVNEHYY
jgi:phytoene dehydrogenase